MDILTILIFMFLAIINIILLVVYRKQVAIIIKTLPRDARGLCRLVRLLIYLRRTQREDLSVAKLFDRVVAQHPLKTCFQYEDDKWTFKQVQNSVNQIANYFQSIGFRKGDTIALFMENRPEYVCIWLGLSKVGIVPALINYNLRLQSLRYSFEIINSKAIIYGYEQTLAIQEVQELGGLQDPNVLLFSSGHKRETLLPNTIDFDAVIDATADYGFIPLEHVGFKDSLYYVYTSGTTGLPKAAIICNYRFIMTVSASHFVHKIREDDILYTALPLYHTSGGTLGAGQPLLFGTTAIIRKKFSASNFWTDCQKYKVTVSQYIGEIARYLMNQPPSPNDKAHTVRMLYGNGLSRQLWEKFTERFGIREIYEFYGSTEGNCNMVNITSRVGAVGFLPVLVKRFAPIQLIKVSEVDGEPMRNPKNGFAIRCEVDEPGELIGKIVETNPLRDFRGYADANSGSKKIITDVFTKGDKYFRSGDLLCMDKYGYFYFKDRSGDTFRWKGENVSTAEVESIISQICGLKDTAVYGVEVTGAEGRAGMISIADPEGTLDLDKLAQGVTKGLPSYARPLFLRVLQEIDMTGTYKIKKLDLQKEGYDVTLTSDRMYFFQDGKYVVLDELLFNQIDAGQIKL